jgi:hypothetical protein
MVTRSPENITVAQILINFSNVYANGRQIVGSQEPPAGPYSEQMNSENLRLHLFEIHYNINLPSRPRASKGPISFRFSTIILNAISVLPFVFYDLLSHYL